MSMPSRSATRVLGWVIVLISLGVGIVLGLFTSRMHRSFAFSAYDVGLHLQAIWKLSRLDGIFNTIRGMNYWGDHLWLTYALLAPVYRIWPSATLVYLYQGVGLAAGGIAVWGLGTRWLRSRLLAFAATVLYWCYPGLIYSSQENFHPEVLASSWLLVMLWAEAARHPVLYWIAVTLALLTKEDVALYLMGFAAYTFLRGEHRRGVTLAVVSALYFLVAMKVLLPYFNGVGFFRMQGGYWFSGLAVNAFDSAFWVAKLTNPDVRTFARDILTPVAFLPVLHPVMLVVLAGPAFAVDLIGGGYLLNVHYHYLYGIIPGVFAATLASLRTLENLGTRWIRWHWLRALGVVAVAAAMLTPTLRIQIGQRERSVSYYTMVRRIRSPLDLWEKARRLEELIAQIPADAKVSASHNVVPRFANRSWIFMFPNPWRPYYWGIDGENQQPPEVVDTLLLDLGVVDADITRLAREIVAQGWEVLADEGQVFYARRVQPTP